jgi:hypothetical protein
MLLQIKSKKVEKDNLETVELEKQKIKDKRKISTSSSEANASDSFANG